MGVVSGGGGGSQPVQSSAVTLSSAQIKALHDTPAQLVAAPGSNKAILVLGGYGELHAGATPYNIGIIGGMPIGYAGQSDVSGVTELGNFNPNLLASAVTSVSQAAPAAGGGLWTLAEANNKALVIFTTDENPTAGDGTLDITLFYTTATLG